MLIAADRLAGANIKLAITQLIQETEPKILHQTSFLSQFNGVIENFTPDTDPYSKFPIWEF